MLGRLRANLRQLRAALVPMRQRGLSLSGSLLHQLPAALLLRAWRRVAQLLDARLLNRPLNSARFDRFQQALPANGLLRVYVIVMPHTLHFLLPCLRLLQHQMPPVSLVLVANGAKAWELSMLRDRLPGVPMFRLHTLPGSSLPHGDALSLLLTHHRGDFLVVDHDAYVFDPTLLSRLSPAPQESLVAVFEQYSQAAGRHYPLTHVLALHAEPLRRLMLKHGIDARQYRRAPQRLASALASIGMGPRRYLKDYQQFHDTAHVLLGMALAEGWPWRLEAMDEDAPVMHVGGTSIGSHHTKNLFALYVHLRFLELLDDAPLIRKRYAFLTWPLRSSVEAQLRAVPHDPAWQTLPVLEALMQRLSDLNPKA